MTSGPHAFYALSRFDPQELKIGVRFMLRQEAPPPPPVYAPPPALMRNG
jgi:hypothetical protein